jgi:hypothetical protein
MTLFKGIKSGVFYTMRRSICQCEPSNTCAGNVSTWNFIYTTSVSLPKGTRFKFDLMTKGRGIDWEIPDVGLKKSSNVIFAAMEGQSKHLVALEVETPDSFTPQYEFIIPSKLEAGKTFTITVGASKEKGKGTAAQTWVQRRRPFHLYIDPTGKGHYQEPEVFLMDIRGNVLDNIRILAPSFVTKNKRFDVTVRFEDEFGNLTPNAPTDTLVELTHESQRENLNWKLFIPETGFITLPNLYFNEVGTYTIQLKNLSNGDLFYSSPIRCFINNKNMLFWGLLHGESERIDSTENIENCLRHFRDDRSMNFFASSPFENAEETSNEIWKLISQNITEFNEDDRFTTLLGFQWGGTASKEGIRQFVYAKDNKMMLRKKDAKNTSLKKIYRSTTPKEFISIPSFTMAKGFSYDFKDFEPEFERVVEIYNAWGSSECTKKEGNTLPIKGTGKFGTGEIAEGSLIKALNENKRFGFSGGGLDDRGDYGDFYDSDQVQYTPGLTGIVAESHTRDALVEALYNRSCYATTGERIILGINLAGNEMGSELSTEDKPGFAVNRHLSGFVAGTKTITKVEIIRNGIVIEKISPKDYHYDFAIDDMTPLDEVTIIPKSKEEVAFVYYYLRVTQEDGHMAWSSPIWIDHPLQKAAKSKKKK